MSNSNDLFVRMCKEAQEELASGKAGTNWQDLSPNILIMACFGMLTNHLTHNITRPLWFFSTSVFVGVLGYIIHLVLG